MTDGSSFGGLSGLSFGAASALTAHVTPATGVPEIPLHVLGLASRVYAKRSLIA
jgi:hypothetical protein